jgi:hypothetical protein
MTEPLEKNPHEIVEMSPYDILVDGKLHPRATIFETTIYEYAEALSNGITLPPIEVFFDGKIYLLADGFYRLEAHLLEGLDSIPVIVHQGGRKEVVIHAVGANADHGLRRTNADKEKAVTIALTDPDIQGMSDSQIAIICRVSQPYVGKIRKKLTYNGYRFEATRVCSDGRIMDVSGITARKNAEPTSEEHEPETSEVGNNNDEVPGPSDQENPEENVGTDSEGDTLDEKTQGDRNTPPETESGNDDQDLNLDESENDEDVLDTDDTTDPETTDDTTEDNPETDENPDTNDNLATDNDENTDSEIEIEDPDEVTDDDNPDTGDLDVIDPDALKLMVVHLQDTAKQQQEELKVKDNEIVDLEQQVEKLEEENIYLKEQLQGLAASGIDVSASLDINEMNKMDEEEDAYSMA